MVYSECSPWKSSRVMGNLVCAVSHWELNVGVMLHFSNTSPWSSAKEKGIDSRCMVDTDSRPPSTLLTYFLTYLLTNLYRVEIHKSWNSYSRAFTLLLILWLSSSHWKNICVGKKNNKPSLQSYILIHSHSLLAGITTSCCFIKNIYMPTETLPPPS